MVTDSRGRQRLAVAVSTVAVKVVAPSSPYVSLIGLAERWAEVESFDTT